MRQWIVLVWLGLGLLFAGSVWAGSREAAETAFQEGVRLYEQEQYRQALSAWRRVLQEEFESADLYLNLGNAAYKSGEAGWAIYYFEHARRLSPRDPDIALNLALARRETLGGEVEAVRSPLLDRIARIQDSWTLAATIWAGVALLWVAAGLVALTMVTGWQRPRKATRVLAIGLTVFGILFIGAKTLQAALAPEALTVVGIAARSEPEEEATVEFRLPPGSPVDLGRTAPGWREVIISASLRGWVPDSDLALFRLPR